MFFSNKKLKYFAVGFLASSILFSINIYYRQSKVNSDDLKYEMSFPKINHRKILNDTNKIKIIFIANSRCPGVDYALEKLKYNLTFFKKYHIKSFVVFDEVLKKSEDQNLSEKIKSFKKDEIFVIDNLDYEKKQGVYNSWNRYLSFIKKFDSKIKKSELSYPKYFILNNNKIVYAESKLDTTRFKSLLDIKD